MKIYLIQPPIEDFYTTPVRNIPQGLLSLAAGLNQHELRLLDLRTGKPRKIELPAELKPIRQFYREGDASPFGLYKAYYRFGLSASEIRQVLPNDGDCYLISSLFTTYAATTYELIRLIGEIAPRANIIVGGPQATIQPDEMFREGADFVIRGEGEIALPLLLQALESAQPALKQIPNLSWCDDTGQIRHNPVNNIANLDDLPFANYRVTGMPSYYFQKRPQAMIISSRGCPHRCAFCCIHQTMGGDYRVRSVENVLAEMTTKIAQGFRSFDFEDDHLGGARDWFLALLKGIQRQFGNLNLSLQAMNGITAANLDEEILAAMWQAGFRSLNLALVTPSEARQRHIRRPFGTGKYLQVAETAQRLGFFITTYLIIGLPGDRAEDLLAAILFLAPIPTLIGPSLFYLVPGTATFRLCAELGQIPSSALCYRSAFFPVESKGCDRTAAMTLFRICRILNFMREVIDLDLKSDCPKIVNDGIYIDKITTGCERWHLIGLGLLHLLFERGILCGTRRKEGDFYPLQKEIYNPGLIEQFIRGTWQISGIRRPAKMTNIEFLDKYLNLGLE